MKNPLFKTLLTVTSILTLGTVTLGSSPIVLAEEKNYVPETFENVSGIDEVVQQLDSFYLQNSPSYFVRAAAGTKWGNGQVVWNGGNGYIINYFWVKGSSMVSWNIVGNAQQKAVIAKYGTVSPNKTYKMKTQQFVVKTPKWQTQGIITTSARAWCYGRD